MSRKPRLPRICRDCSEVISPDGFLGPATPNRTYICDRCLTQRVHGTPNEADGRRLNLAKKAGISAPGAVFREARKAAAKRGYSWTLDVYEWLELKAHPCRYCGYAVESTRGGLDRLDNTRGYEPGNVVPCCYACNVAKSDIWDYEETLEIGRLIATLRARREAQGRPFLPPRLKIVTSPLEKPA
jgi:hypothetical protein